MPVQAAGVWAKSAMRQFAHWGFAEPLSVRLRRTLSL
jgi:hypothetical protein